MTNSDPGSFRSSRRLRTPRAAAFAGILFALLYSSSYAMIILSSQGEYASAYEWHDRHADRLRLAMRMLPYAGIAFLWFMGVLRDRLKRLEDQFYSTLFLGTGFLYLGMTFVAAAIASGLMSVDAFGPDSSSADPSYPLMRSIMYQVASVYSVRMAGMFMTVLGTIWFHTGLMPRWLAAFTFVGAVALLVSISITPWIIMVFPAWVLIISLYILIAESRLVNVDLASRLAGGGRAA